MASGTTSDKAHLPKDDIPEVPAIGLTVLSNPDENDENTNPFVDLCFVHGLGGNPFKTWQGPRAEDKSKGFSKRLKSAFEKKPAALSHRPYYWPFDLVSHDFKTTRVMTYGYDSKPTQWYKGGTNQMTIDQLSQTMLQDISNERVHCRKRPIIFVAHSLGGILVKNMLIQSGKYITGNFSLKDIRDSCRAIVFFGTPHRGSGAADLGLIVANLVSILPAGPSVYKNNLQGLRPDSEKLQSIISDFNDILDEEMPLLQKIQLYSFQEGIGYSKISGLDQKVVPDNSSVFNRRMLEKVSHIAENHMNMCRFKGANDPGYRAFKAALNEYLENIKEHPRAGTGAEARGIQDNHPIQDNAGILASLDFQERTTRSSQLAETQTQEQTFEWIWTSEFKSWLESSEPLFWISGKPASGKSTLMSHMSMSVRLTNLLRSSSGENWVVIHHFFDFRGRETIRNNILGLLKSLLLQLLWHFPESIAVIESGEKRAGRKIDQWTTQEFQTALDEFLALPSGPMIILLDGLDEYGGNHFELCRLAKHISSPQRKVCLASRPDPPFPDAFRTKPQLRMDQLNKPGILLFAKTVFLDFWDPQDPDHCNQLESLAENVATQAEGVFLWARFAVLEIMDGQTCGDDPDELKSRLQQVPRELSDIYSRALSKKSGSQKETASRLFQFLRYTKTTLTLQEVFVAMALTHSSVRYSLDSSDGLVGSEELASFRRRILASSGSIVELTQYRKSRQGIALEPPHFDKMELVHVIHRTVESYLDEGGWSDLQLQPIQPHYLWVQAGSNLLQLPGSHTQLVNIIRTKAHTTTINHEGVVSSRRAGLGRKDSVPLESNLARFENEGLSYHTSVRVKTDLLGYILLHLLDHAREYEEATKKSSYHVLSGVMSNTFIEAHQDKLCHFCYRMLRRESYLSPITESSYRPFQPIWMHAAILHRLGLFVQDCLKADGSRTDGTAHGFASPSGSLVNRFISLKLGATGNDLLKAATQSIFLVSGLKDPAHVAILERCLHFNPTVPGHSFRLAIREASLYFLEILFEKARTASGELIFESDANDYSSKFDATMKKGPPIRPLWDVARRKSTEDIEEIVGLCISKGEDINGPCGPLGTALHSMTHGVYEGTCEEMLEVFVNFGANINAPGPKGNPLEYLWMRANTSQRGKMKYVTPYRSFIHALLDMGAVNGRKDPNGEVPSVERMRMWPSTGPVTDDEHVDYWEYVESKRFYREGPQ